jgi:hypothetical protein
MASSAKAAEKASKPKPVAGKAVSAKPVAVTKPAAAKPAAAKSATAKPAAATAAKPATKSPASKAGKSAKPEVAGSASVTALAPDQRRFYIEVAAYYIAERRGFHGGGELSDWVQAESEIDRLLDEGILNP